MLVKIIIKKDGSHTHEVIEREEGEQCARIFELNTGRLISDVVTGPDCDSAEERAY
jgi:hypothetical protein